MNAHTQYAPIPKSTGHILSPLLVFLVAGFALRLALAVYFPRIYHPDETYQILEQAYSFYAKDTILPWEYRENIRSWLWPILVAIFAYPAEKLFGTAFAFKLSAQILFSLVSLCGIWAAWSIGRLKSEYHAWIGGFVAAFWFEFIYFSPHILMDVASTHILLAAIAFLMKGGERNTFIYGGALLAVTFIMRIQLAPALVFLAIYFCRLDFRQKWLPLVLGGIGPLIVYGVVDWIMIGIPFSSIYNYFIVNLIQDKASTYGVSPFYAYLGYYYFNIYNSFVLFIIILLFMSERRWHPLIGAGLIIVFFHSLIPHKEYRFIYSATFILIITAFYSAINIVLKIFEKRPIFATGFMSLICLGSSIFLILSDNNLRKLYYNRVEIDAFAWIEKQADICGIGLLGSSWDSIPGRVGVRGSFPIYPDVGNRTDGTADFIQSYNILVADLEFQGIKRTIPPEFNQQICFSAPQQAEICVYKRAGTCTPNPGKMFNAYLLSRGQ